MYIPRARVSKKFNYLNDRAYGAFKALRRNNQNTESAQSLPTSNNKEHGNAFKLNFQLNKQLSQSKINMSQRAYKSCYAIELQQTQQKLEELLANNVEVTQSTEKKYEQFYSEMGKIEAILEQKTQIYQSYYDQYCKLCKQIDVMQQQIKQREKFISQLSKDLGTLGECQKLRDQMLQKIEKEKVEKQQQEQQDRDNQAFKIQLKFKMVQSMSLVVQTDFDSCCQDDSIQEQRSSPAQFSQEYKQTLRKAIEQQNVYYQLKTQVYEVRNQIGLVKNEFNAYRITKQIEEIQSCK